MPLSCGAEYTAAPIRLAGTIRQYSKKAMPQLTRITVNSGAERYFGCPYQAKVMNTLEPTSSNTGSRRSRAGLGHGRSGGMRTMGVFTALVQRDWQPFTKLKTPSRKPYACRAGDWRAGPDRRGQPQYFGNGGRVSGGPRVRGRLRRRRPRRLPAGGGEQLRRDRAGPDAAAPGWGGGVQAAAGRGAQVHAGADADRARH